MKIPQYIIELLSRSRFALGYGDPGYTIEIEKSTPYTKVNTHKLEIERLVAWCERQMPHDNYSIPVAVINKTPPKTHYCRQHSAVTIYDPLMKLLEKYIPARKEDETWY